MTKEDLLRKVRVHVEVTEDCIMNTNLDKHTEELLKQDNDLFKEVISFLADEKVKVIIDQANVSGSFLFDKSLLEKATIKQPEYVMGVDTYDKNAFAYCFGRKVDGVFEIMLSKTMRDENEFNQEVENLAKYFNADVFRSGE